MKETLDNNTLKQILDQLKNLNNNLSTGNLLGDKNKMFNQTNEKFDSLKAQRKSLKDDIEVYKSIIEDKKSYSKEDRTTAKDDVKDLQKQLNNVRYQTAVLVAPAVKQAVSTLSNVIFTVWEASIKKQTVKLQTASELQTRAIQTYGKALNNAIGVQVGNITGTVLDTAYQSLNAVLEGGRSMYMKSLSDAISYRQRENELYKANAEATWGVIDEVGGALSAIPGKIGLLGNAISLMANVGKRRAMLIAAQTELEIKQDEEVRKNQDEWLQQIEGVVKQFADMSKQVTKSFLEAGNSAYVYGRTLGLSTGVLRNYHDTLIESVNVGLAQIGLDYTDYVKMQQSYIEATGGRGGIVGGEEATLIGALSKRLGITVEQSAAITGAMNIFNTSISDGSEMIYEMAKTANRMGLNATKFAKDMEKNLKLAEKYQFRGGVKGLMEMALWAQKTRFNIEELSSLQEKYYSGNIEDIIQTSARLNVLGGAAAMYSDPMGMFFDALQNPQGLGDRINKMVAGFGTFNARTGETNFSNAELLRMSQIASATGMSRENIMNQARQARKAEEIERMYGGRFDKTTLEGITQHATWSTEKNGWVVKVNAPGTKEGFREVGVNEVRSEDLENIFPEDKQDRLLDYVQDIRNFLSPGELQTVAEKGSLAATMAEASKQGGLFEIQKQLAEEREAYTRSNASKNADIVLKYSEAALATQRQMNAFVSSGGANSLVEGYLAFSMEQNNKLLEDTQEFVASGKTIEQKLEQIRFEILGIRSIENEKGQINQNELSDLNKKINSEEEIRKILQKTRTYETTTTMGGNRKQTGKSRFLTEEEIEKYMQGWNKGEYTFVNGFPQKLNTYTGKLQDYKFEYTANDAIITPRGAIYTHPDDTIMAFKPGGPISHGLNGGGTTRIEVNGTLKLDSGNQTIDLMELVKNNPQFTKEITEMVITKGYETKYGGRSPYAPNRYTLG